MTTETLYFQYNPEDETISMFADRSQRTGGKLQPNEGSHGIGFDAFKKACAGKIVASGDTFVIKPATRNLRDAYPALI